MKSVTIWHIKTIELITLLKKKNNHTFILKKCIYSFVDISNKTWNSNVELFCT